MRAYITGIGVWGPGLPGWPASRAVLAGCVPWVGADTPPPPPSILSATERRRTGVAVRLALAVAQQAIEMSGEAPETVASVFGSANGDGAVVHSILVALTGAEGLVSPTQFHNSVHNAAAGYWTIATGSHQAATSLGCHDATFAASLLKAMAELRMERRPMLLCVYDAPLPEPLQARRPTGAPFAAALVLSPEPKGAVAQISVRHAAEAGDPRDQQPIQPALRAIAAGNPAARALRLLEHLARGTPATISVAYLDGRIDIDMQPCPTSRS